MSERRAPVYEKYLNKANASHILTPEEQSAYEQYKNLSQQFSTLISDRDHYQRFLNDFPESRDPSMHAHIKGKIDDISQKLDSLRPEIFFLVTSRPLINVAHRVMDDNEESRNSNTDDTGSITEKIPVTQKPVVWKSLLSFVLCLPTYTITYTLFALVFSFVAYLLFYLPLIGDLLTWLFHARGDSPDMVLALLAPALSYVVVKASLEKIVKHVPSRGLGCKIFGVFMIVIQALSLLVNIFSSGGGYILTNIIQIIVGFCFFNLGRDYCDQSNS